MTTEIKELIAFSLTWITLGCVILIWAWLLCRSHNKRYRKDLRQCDKMNLNNIFGFKVYLGISIALLIVFLGVFVFNLILQILL